MKKVFCLVISLWPIQWNWRNLFLFLFSKLINLAEPDTIDLRAIHRGKKVSLFQKHENLNTAISSAKVSNIFCYSLFLCPNVSTTPITANGCRQCLPFKSQLISKELFVFFNSPKKRTKNFCPSRLGQKLTFSTSFFGGIADTRFSFRD